MRRTAPLLASFSLLALTALSCREQAVVQPAQPAHAADARAHAPEASAPAASPPEVEQARNFLDFYNGVLPALNGRAQEAFWAAATDVTEQHTGARVGADAVLAGFLGSGYVVEHARALLAHQDVLSDRTRRELRFALLDAAYAPGSNPELARRRIEAEARQSAALDGYTYCLDAHAPGTPCAHPASANAIDSALRTSTDLAARQRVWERSKDLGDGLRAGLLELRDLRNRVAREMGYSDFYALQIADYGMSTDELMGLLDRSIEQLRPLFLQLHCWGRRHYAERYHRPTPQGPMPAHWVGNRWAQSWPGLVTSVDLDGLMRGHDAPWIVHTAEQYYVSMGFSPLPQTFWERSDLYPVPAGGPRHKNAHASAWHIDLESDVRSLMSVEPDGEWFATAHHELGHIYYYQSYTRPEVPPVLRRGANRGFHEAVGDLIALSVVQQPYLRQLGLLAPGVNLDDTQLLLDEALSKGPVFFMFGAGTMSHFERDLYAGNLPAGELNARWWQYARRYQGVEPPGPRDETHCDACTKTHINDDPGQYYDYALATMLVYQLHEHLCRTYVHADPHACTYAGNREVGDALRRILREGALRDWRALLRETTGEDLSAAALLRYFEPLRAFLDRENAGQQCGADWAEASPARDQ